MEISRFDAMAVGRGRMCAQDAPAKDPTQAPTKGGGDSDVAGAAGAGDAAVGASLTGEQMQSLAEVLTRLTDALRGVVEALQGIMGGGTLPPPSSESTAPSPAADPASATQPATNPDTPVSSNALTDGADAAATVQPSDDAGLVNRILTTLDQSETGRQIAQGLRNMDVTVSLASDEEMNSSFGANVMGYYDLGSDTIVLRRSHAIEDPKFAAYILAHEGKHAIDDATGMEDKWLNDAKLAAQSVQNPEQFLKQKTLEQTLVAETTAFTVGALVAEQLGITPMIDDPAFGPNGRRDYAEIWNVLVQSKTYNPDGLEAPEPRTWDHGVAV